MISSSLPVNQAETDPVFDLEVPLRDLRCMTEMLEALNMYGQQDPLREPKAQVLLERAMEELDRLDRVFAAILEFRRRS